MKPNFEKICISTTQAKWLMFLFGILWVTFHIITLERSPIPNFDEAFFASITRSVQDDGTLMLRMSTRAINEANEIWLYGPVYFYAQDLITEIIGWGIWQFRLLNFLSGVLLVVVILNIAKKLSFGKLQMIILVSLLITDTALNANMHSGRMDSLAMLLFTIGMYFFFFPPSTAKIYTIIAGAFYSLAFLTTPRTGFLLLILPVGFAIESFWSFNDQSRTGMLLPRLVKTLHLLLLKYAIPFVMIVGPFFLWVQFRVGGIENYLRFFAENQDLAPLYKIVNLPAFYQLPALALWIVAILSVTRLLLLNNTIKWKFSAEYIDRRIVFIVILPVLYICFIKGGYSVLLMPWIYVVLVYLTSYLSVCLRSFWGRNLLIFACIGIVILNTAIFGIKSLAIAASWQSRDPAHFTKYFKNININGENILASFPYHFVIAEANKFISNDSHKELSLEKIDTLKIQHAFITKQYYVQDKQHFDSLGFELIDSFSFEKKINESKLIDFLRKLPLDILWETDGVHLKRSLTIRQTYEQDRQ
jgi:hypothetical protein